MHHISKITIKNYKSIIDAEFPLCPYTPLVGYNNAGKTNILKAISWIVNKYGLPEVDFHNPDDPVVVTAEISGISEPVLNAIGDNHRQRIEPLIEDERLHIRRVQPYPNARAADLRFEVWKKNDDEEYAWADNPAGIDAAIKRLFPDPLFIGAMENAVEDVGKFGTGTTIGKLLKEILNEITEAYAEQVNQDLAGIAAKLSANSEEKDETLAGLDVQIQGELGKFFPGVMAKTHIPTAEFSDFLKGATIKIFEEGYHNPNGRDASSFGHGAQRSVQIALIKCLAEKRRGNAEAARTTLLLIDEPELYLHPQAIELVRSSLSKLAEEGYQVAFSTHSANMISREDAANALLIRRNAAAGTKAYPRIRDAVTSAVEGAGHQSETLFTLTNSTKILFSERVALAEGKTEQAILPTAYYFEKDHTLDEAKIGLVALGSSGNIPGAMSVLSAMGIPTKSVVDLDFAFKVAPQTGLLAEDHVGIIGCKQIFGQLEAEDKCSLDDAGLPQKGQGISAAQAYELMAAHQDAAPHIQSIHDELLANQIWIWKKGAIEAHLGLQSKKPAIHMAFLRDLHNEGFRDGLPDYAEFQSMLEWLSQPN